MKQVTSIFAEAIAPTPAPASSPGAYVPSLQLICVDVIENAIYRGQLLFDYKCLKGFVSDESFDKIQASFKDRYLLYLEKYGLNDLLDILGEDFVKPLEEVRNSQLSFKKRFYNTGKIKRFFHFIKY